MEFYIHDVNSHEELGLFDAEIGPNFIEVDRILLPCYIDGNCIDDKYRLSFYLEERSRYITSLESEEKVLEKIGVNKIAALRKEEYSCLYSCLSLFRSDQDNIIVLPKSPQLLSLVMYDRNLYQKHIFLPGKENFGVWT